MLDAAQVVWLVWIAVLGLAVGSFLNVCIQRLPRRESIVYPASRCPHCGQPIRWYDNLPLVSYLLLGGRCRTCKGRISLQYPLVETVTAALFVASYLQIGLSPLLVSRSILSAALVALFVIDLHHRILPDSITKPGIVLGFAFSFFMPPGWRDSLLGILVGGGLLLVLAEIWFRFRRVQAMGGGDLKMLAMIGAFLGWQLTLVTAFLGVFLGSIAGMLVFLRVPGGSRYVLSLVALLAVLYVSLGRVDVWLELIAIIGLLLWLVMFLRNRALQTLTMPFGTFLAVAAVVSSFLGDHLLGWIAAWCLLV